MPGLGYIDYGGSSLLMYLSISSNRSQAGGIKPKKTHQNQLN